MGFLKGLLNKAKGVDPFFEDVRTGRKDSRIGFSGVGEKRLSISMTFPLGIWWRGLRWVLGIPVSIIRGMSRDRIGALGRSIVGYLGRKLAGYSLSSIADYFRRDPVSLCQGIAKVEKRMMEGDGFREKLMGLEKNLVEGRKRKIKK